MFCGWTCLHVLSLALSRLSVFVCVCGGGERGEAYGLCQELRARHVCASPSELYHAGKLQWYFICGFHFRHSLWLSFVVAFTVLKGLKQWQFEFKKSFALRYTTWFSLLIQYALWTKWPNSTFDNLFFVNDHFS